MELLLEAEGLTPASLGVSNIHCGGGVNVLQYSVRMQLGSYNGVRHGAYKNIAKYRTPITHTPPNGMGGWSHPTESHGIVQTNLSRALHIQLCKAFEYWLAPIKQYIKRRVKDGKRREKHRNK
jgi:hypothetical protein